MPDDHSPGTLSPLNACDYRVGPPQTEWLIVPAVQDPDLEVFKATLKPNGILEFSALPKGRDITSGAWYPVTDPGRVQFLREFFDQHRGPVVQEIDPNCTTALIRAGKRHPKTGCQVHGLLGCPGIGQVVAGKIRGTFQ
jgi:hypothetical protein